MKFFRILLFGCSFLANQLDAKSTSSGEETKLLNLAYTLKAYMGKSDMELPADLAPLRDYVDLPRLLRPDTDPLDLFPDRYTFLPSKPWMEVSGEPPRQLLLICVNPLPDGSRGAIWRYRDGEYAGGLISARELEAGLINFDLTALKPMGGEVPAPTHPFPEAPITEYQAKVMQLVGAAKITLQPRSDGTPSKEATSPYPISIESVPPATVPADRQRQESGTRADEQGDAIWPRAIGCLVIVGIGLFAWKKRS